MSLSAPDADLVAGAARRALPGALGVACRAASVRIAPDLVAYVAVAAGAVTTSRLWNPAGVFRAGYGFQVRRIETGRFAAQVIDGRTLAKGLDHQLMGDSMHIPCLLSTEITP